MFHINMLHNQTRTDRSAAPAAWNMNLLCSSCQLFKQNANTSACKFELTKLLRKIPEATQICQSLSQEFSLKGKVSVARLCQTSLEEAFFPLFLSYNQHNMAIVPFMSFSLSNSAVHYINQTWPSSLKKLLKPCIFTTSIMNVLGWCGYGEEKYNHRW